MVDQFKTLLCAVIHRAVDDLALPRRRHRDLVNDAEDFLTTKRLDRFIQTHHLDLSPSYIRDRVRKEKL